MISLLATFLAVASKYVFNWNKKHIFNPSAFGIVAIIYLTDERLVKSRLNGEVTL